MKNFRGKHYICQMLVLFGALALGICLFFLLFYMDEIRGAARRLLGILRPFIYGAVIAYLLKPMCNVLERWMIRLLLAMGVGRRAGGKAAGRGMKAARGAESEAGGEPVGGRPAPEAAAARIAGPLSVFASIVIGIGVIAALLMMVIPQVLGSLSGLVVLIQDNLDRFAQWVTQYMGEQNVLTNYIESISEGLSDRVALFIQQELLPNLQALVTGVTSGVASLVTVFSNLFIGLIVAIYLLGSRRRFAAQSKLLLFSVFKEKWANIMINEVKFADRMFGGFINGKLLDSAIIGVICFIFTWITRMPFGVLVSVIVGVTNIIPFFGPYLGAIPSALLILMVSPTKCLIFLVFIIILQQFDGNVLGPRILGNVTGLSSFWVLFAILTFGGLFGFVGMIVGVPVFAVIYDIIKKLIHRGLARRGKLAMEEDYRKVYPEDDP